MNSTVQILYRIVGDLAVIISIVCCVCILHALSNGDLTQTQINYLVCFAVLSSLIRYHIPDRLPCDYCEATMKRRRRLVFFKRKPDVKSRATVL